ncbi:MAG: tRNA dihydrouridine(20/20a) synthase DusA [Deltaproteobacteria bacterium]|nr:tRNA dihydrouridine(20/20a) synthase DusA [Deltaproteobacteria bacterium]MBK8238111.1 tRNA dihydrouridine(20/20a) synthase DusA [Deltaproteobacteria bacterium]MBP7288607.1 tRNA dihydrouridine(20/20a) synthase DusA [Nannocystaceae bacterium]
MPAPWRFSVAPMMDRTDRHFRWLFRHISAGALLYTPMIAADAIVRGRADAELAHEPCEQPLALQLGGSEPATLAAAARIGAARGFVEIDLNCGCPSPTAASSRWGVALMDEPARVAEMVAAMVAVAGVDVTVKHRLGIAGRDHVERLHAFVDAVASAGAARVIVHARAAVLGGLAPARNRSVPPLRPDEVHALVAARPGLPVIYNGGLLTPADAAERLRDDRLAGVMIGRSAYDDPWAWREVDPWLYGVPAPTGSRREIAVALRERAQAWARTGADPYAVTRHAMGLWRALPGARRARAAVASLARGGGLAALDAAIAVLP